MSYKTKRILYGILLAIALPALYLMSFDLEFQKSDLKTVKGTLAEDPEFDTWKSQPYLNLYLNQFENRFKAEGFSYYALKKNKLKSQVKKGDKVYLSITTYESASWVDKINRTLSKNIEIVELWTDEESYISLNDYNEYRKKDHKFTYVAWVIALVYYIYWLRKNNHAETIINKS